MLKNITKDLFIPIMVKIGESLHKVLDVYRLVGIL